MASLGSALLGLMGTKDPRQQLAASMLGAPPQPGAGGSTPAGGAPAPGTTPAPEGPPQPEVYRSPPELLELYSSLQEYSNKANTVDKGIGMLGAAFAQEANRDDIMAAYSGNQSNPNADFEMLMGIQAQQQELAATAAAKEQQAVIREQALIAAEKLGMDPTTAAYLDSTDQLGSYIADVMKPKDPGLTYRPMTPEEITERNYDPSKNWEIGSNGNVQQVGESGTVVNIDNTGAINDVDEKFLQGMDDQLTTVSYPAAQASVSTIASVSQAAAAMNSPGGIITGSAMAPWENEVRKVAADMFGISDPATVNTEQYEAAQADVIRSKIKELGTGNAISNADLAFTQKSVGSGGQIPEEAIPRILKIMEVGSYNQVLKHNMAVDAAIAGRGPDINPQVKAGLDAMRIPVPEISIPSDSIAYLKADPSPENKAFFDEKYGPGTADNLLMVK